MGVFLRNEGYTVFEAENGRETLEMYSTQELDLILLDVMMSELDSWSLCRKIKAESDVAVFMMNASCDNADEVFGFKLGVDDYIRKPFSPRVLMARIASLKRKLNRARSIWEPYGVLELNRAGHSIRLNSQSLDLSPKEYELLRYLMEHKSQALSRDQILNSVWDFNYYNGTRTVDTHVKKLRIKLQDYSFYIQTVRNYGYRFEIDEP